MLQWLAANLGTIFICGLLTGIVAAIIIHMIKDRKNGRSCCGGTCGGCAMSGMCHSAHKEDGAHTENHSAN